MIEVLQSKIHRIKVTDVNINYEGSITLSQNLCDKAGIREYQKVLIVDINNGVRFETYVIITETEGVVAINGAAARLVYKDDLIIIMSFMYMDRIPLNYLPTVIKVK